MCMKIRIKLKSATKSNEYPLKSKYNSRSRARTKSIVEWGSKNRIFTSDKIKNYFLMKCFGQKIVLY